MRAMLWGVMLLSLGTVASGQILQKFVVRVNPVMGCNETPLEFAYVFVGESNALDFARMVAHQGLERVDPKDPDTTVLYPEILRITVRSGEIPFPERIGPGSPAVRGRTSQPPQ